MLGVPGTSVVIFNLLDWMDFIYLLFSMDETLISKEVLQLFLVQQRKIQVARSILQKFSNLTSKERFLK